MKKNIFTFLFAALLGTIPAAAALALEALPGFRLLPAPQRIKLAGNNNVGVSYGALKNVCLKGGAERPELRYPLSAFSQVEKTGKGTVLLELAEAKDLPASKEGYIMAIKDGFVHIRSRGNAGLFYGCQTLLQLLEDARDGDKAIPNCEITDFPDIEFRAVHWDLKYHLDNLDYYYKMVDRLAAIKINYVVVEFEDKLRYRNDPDVSSNNAISVEEFAALTRYARARHVELVPLMQGLGHVSFILKHDKYKHLRDDRKSDWVFDPLNPETYEVQFRLYDEVIAATPGSKYLHIGGDEVYNLGKSDLCKKSGMKPLELQLYWLSKVCKYVSEKGRIPIFWDDMAFALSGLYGTMFSDRVEDTEWSKSEWKKKQPLLDSSIALFPKNCIYMRWNYNLPKVYGNTKAIDWFTAHGLEAWGASAAQNMSAMLPREHSIFQPIKDFTEVAAERKMRGMLCTAWDDSSPHFETFWRGFYDFGSLSWNYEDITHQEMHKRYRQRFYGSQLADEKYEFQDSLEVALDFWDRALMAKDWNRPRIHYPYDMKVLSLPDSSNPGAWSSEYAERIESAGREIRRHANIGRIIGENLKLANRNRFSLHLYKVMNDLQVYSSELLLKLYEYDMAKDGAKKTAKEQLIQFVYSFDHVRKAYENVYSQTRFLEKAQGDILDQNNDPMLANGTINSDWMYVWELEMISQIKHWAGIKPVNLY